MFLALYFLGEMRKHININLVYENPRQFFALLVWLRKYGGLRSWQWGVLSGVTQQTGDTENKYPCQRWAPETPVTHRKLVPNWRDPYVLATHRPRGSPSQLEYGHESAYFRFSDTPHSSQASMNR